MVKSGLPHVGADLDEDLVLSFRSLCDRLDISQSAVLRKFCTVITGMTDEQVVAFYYSGMDFDKLFRQRVEETLRLLKVLPTESPGAHRKGGK